ncbi:hypothetical protein E4T50_11697 [Aureobasidium sp. EXF-12298]|nr:hypothetical protein E4T50_11697 [Aureobasidium sp. EXF-12298]KAI4763110.1 hypothetical protein E4T51_03875 [Aureobasidium sp. EXF-12344]KAI4780199.1 hypothetical protein E4T52_04883 [Aureobasidium sp. EXF-3400]
MPDYSLLAIPAFTILAVAPHAYALSTVKKHTQWSNANSRGEGNVQHMKKTLPPAVFATFERAEAAHKNSMETLPLFIAATLSGVFAEKLTRTDVGNAQFSAIFLGLRVLYTLLYINTSSEQASHARSLTWTAGLALCFYQIYKAAVALA